MQAKTTSSAKQCLQSVVSLKHERKNNRVWKGLWIENKGRRKKDSIAMNLVLTKCRSEPTSKTWSLFESPYELNIASDFTLHLCVSYLVRNFGRNQLLSLIMVYIFILNDWFVCYPNKYKFVCYYKHDRKIYDVIGLRNEQRVYSNRSAGFETTKYEV